MNKRIYYHSVVAYNRIRAENTSLRNQIADLNQQIDQLLESVQQLQDQSAWNQQEAWNKVQAANRHANEIRQEAESTENRRKSELHSATRDLDWSRTTRDRFGESIALDRIRRLSS
jgi:cell division septum initiation protein DivIVA